MAETIGADAVGARDSRRPLAVAVRIVGQHDRGRRRSCAAGLPGRPCRPEFQRRKAPHGRVMIVQADLIGCENLQHAIEDTHGEQHEALTLARLAQRIHGLEHRWQIHADHPRVPTAGRTVLKRSTAPPDGNQRQAPSSIRAGFGLPDTARPGRPPLPERSGAGSRGTYLPVPRKYDKRRMACSPERGRDLDRRIDPAWDFPQPQSVAAGEEIQKDGLLSTGLFAAETDHAAHRSHGRHVPGGPVRAGAPGQPTTSHQCTPRASGTKGVCDDGGEHSGWLPEAGKQRAGRGSAGAASGIGGYQRSRLDQRPGAASAGRAGPARPRRDRFRAG